MKECSGRDDHRSSVILHFQRRFDAINLALSEQQLCSLSLPKVKVRLPFADPFESELISLLVTLRPGSPYCGSFLCVQHSELQSRHVGYFSHLSTDCIDLPS